MGPHDGSRQKLRNCVHFAKVMQKNSVASFFRRRCIYKFHQQIFPPPGNETLLRLANSPLWHTEHCMARIDNRRQYETFEVQYETSVVINQ